MRRIALCLLPVTLAGCSDNPTGPSADLAPNSVAIYAQSPVVIAWSTVEGPINSYDYGTVDPGTTSSQTFTLTNWGGRGSGPVPVTLTGSPAFAITDDGCNGGLGPGKSCTVTVAYAPTGAGQADAATLLVDGKQATASLALTGASTAASSGYIYWADANAGTIGRANRDGTGVELSFIDLGDPYSYRPTAVAVDGSHI